MTQDRWARIEELYHQARARPAEEWPAFLREACPDDSAVRDEVASLLAHAPLSETVTAGPVAVSLAPGATLAHYRIEARVGAGGMGEVFRGVDTRLQRSVAIKVAGTAFNLRFRREAQALAALNHPHICTLYDVGPDYLVMEFVEGKTLADRLLRGPLPLGDVLRFGTQITSALSEAHVKGITHRDLKPANVMLTRSGVKLLDFGLASLGDQSLTRTGAVMGTPAYMAPEQFQGRDAGPQTDIYALGLLLHEMATAKRPVIRPGEPPGLEPLPDTLAHVVTRCLAEDSDARWRSASEIGALLEWFARSRETKTSPAAGISRRGLLVGGGGAVMAASGVGAWAGWMARDRSGAAMATVSPLTHGAHRGQILPPPLGHFVTGDPNHGGMAISPNGRWLAYVAMVDKVAGLWVYPLDPRDGEARELSRTEGAPSRPFWSPDSKSIAFAQRGSLVSVDIENQAARTLTTLERATNFAGGTWLPDERIVFAGATGQLFQVSDNGGEPTPLIDPSPGEAHMYPQWLEEDRILYLASRGKPDTSAIYVISLANPDPELVLRSNTNVLYASGYLLSRNSNGAMEARKVDPLRPQPTEPQIVVDRLALDAGRISASVSRNGVLVFGTSDERYSLRWIDWEGNPIGMAVDSTNRGNPRLSPNGLPAAFTERSGSLSLFGDHGLIRLGSGRDFISPVFSPDGATLIVSANSGQQDDRAVNLFRMSISGEAPERVTESTQGQFATDWSRTGLVLYTQANHVGADGRKGAALWVVQVDANGRRVGQPSLYKEGAWGGFFPADDPRWVAYQSDKRGGRNEIYVSSFPYREDRERQVSLDGGAYPKWDSQHRLYYWSLNGSLIRATLKVDHERVDVVSRDSLFPLPLADVGDRGPFFDVTRDGTKFLIFYPEQSTESTEAFTVVYNWTDILARSLTRAGWDGRG